MSTRPAEIRKIKPHRVKKTFYETIEPWLFLLPALCVFGVFLYFPFFKTLYLSTFLTNKFGQAKIFYGLKNYADILYGKYSREFWNSIWVTVRFVFFVAGGGLLVGLCTSLITVNKFPGKALASAIYAMPIAIASSAAAMSFKMILHKSIGLLNHLLGTSINWLSDTTWTFPIICILSIWLASGINFIFIGAGLRNIPEELYESCRIDGGNELRAFFSIALPLSKPIIAVIALYAAVGQWNGYFNALIYTNKPALQPLQLVLRNVLILNQSFSVADAVDAEEMAYMARRAYMVQTMKYALVFVASAPIMCAYPFVQKYFVKGVMLGSVKG